MRRNVVNLPRRALAVGAVLAMGVMAAVVTTSALAAPTAPASPDPARTLAAQKAAQLVAARPAYLMASTDDRFVAGDMMSSGAMHYVPYTRTYAGVPVVGGDFVLVTDASGDVVFHSVAMDRPIGTMSTTPALSRAHAVAVAKRQLRTVQ